MIPASEEGSSSNQLRLSSLSYLVLVSTLEEFHVHLLVSLASSYISRTSRPKAVLLSCRLSVIIYSMIVLTAIYTYQFEKFPEYWETVLRVDPQL